MKLSEVNSSILNEAIVSIIAVYGKMLSAVYSSMQNKAITVDSSIWNKATALYGIQLSTVDSSMQNEAIFSR